MPQIEFASSIRKHVPHLYQQGSLSYVQIKDIAGGDSVRAILDTIFARHEELRSYILDDQGHVRRHVVIFLNDQPIQDRTSQSDTVGEHDHVFVFQALSGG